VRDGVSVVAFDFPVRVPAVPLQSDARESALDSREPHYAIMDLLAPYVGRRAPVAMETDGLPLAPIVSDVMFAPSKDGRWPTGCVIGPNRKPNAPWDLGPIGMGSTDPSSRSAVI